MNRNSPLTKGLIVFVLAFCLLVIFCWMGIDLLTPIVLPWWRLSPDNVSLSLYQGITALLLSLPAGFLVWLLATLKELRFTIASLKAKLTALENAGHKE